MRDIWQMLNIWHISHTKHKKQLPIRYCICCKIITFVSVPLQICNGTNRCGKPKIIILLLFSLLSFIYLIFSLPSQNLSLSLSEVPNPFFFFSQLDASKKKVLQKKAAAAANHRHPPPQPTTTTTSTNHNHHLNNKTQIQKNLTNPPRHRHILTHNHRNPQPPPTENQTQPTDPLLETTTTNQNHKLS